MNHASAEELSEWFAFLESEPLDKEAWRRTALICATIVNVSRIFALGKVPKEAKLQDFIPRKPRPDQTVAEQIAMLRTLTKGKG